MNAEMVSMVVEKWGNLVKAAVEGALDGKLVWLTDRSNSIVEWIILDTYLHRLAWNSRVPDADLVKQHFVMAGTVAGNILVDYLGSDVVGDFPSRLVSRDETYDESMKVGEGLAGKMLLLAYGFFSFCNADKAFRMAHATFLVGVLEDILSSEQEVLQAIQESETKLPAQLYTPRGKVPAEVTLNQITGSISFFNPAEGETLVVGRNCEIKPIKRGWMFYDFGCVSEETGITYKLTLWKDGGDQLVACLASRK